VKILCCFLGPIGGEDPRQLRRRLVHRAGNLARRRLYEADDRCPKLVEGRERGESLDPIDVEQCVAHRSADDLESVVRLGEVHRDLGGRYGAVHIIDIEQRSVDKIVVWGTVEDGKQRRSFECGFKSAIAYFKLRDIPASR
jgi:hypothetical protein